MSTSTARRCVLSPAVRMAGQISESLLAKLNAQAHADPQLPSPNPTPSFWQLPPHPTLAEIQSETLAATTDYAIIGSGITACSVVKTLFEQALPPPARDFSVTVFEARTLTSGATGRNGGVLTSFAPGDFKLLSETFGRDNAVRIGRFANTTLEKMHTLANSSDELREASEVRRLVDVISFLDDDSFRGAQESYRLYEEHVPEDRGNAQVLTAQETEVKYSMRGVGSIVFNNGAFWPYRLITRIWAQLYTQYRERLSIETNTPVTKVSYDSTTDPKHPYLIHTPRGIVRASKIVHATNGYVGHLLPELRGKIYPLRGTMSTQEATPAFGRHGHQLTWSVIGSGGFDAETQVLDLGLYYASQNVRSGDIFVGGEKATISEILVSDDSHVGDVARKNISTVLPRYFTRGWGECATADGDNEEGKEAGKQPTVKKIWSGIMGFTADRLPLVGPLARSVTKRGVDGGEFIAAGFNGYGMPLCWSCGEAVAKMLLDIDVGDLLPDLFLATEERLRDEQRMATTAAVDLLFGGHP